VGEILNCITAKNDKFKQKNAKIAQLWRITVASPIVHVTGCNVHIYCKFGVISSNGVKVMSIEKQDTPIIGSLGHMILTQCDIKNHLIPSR